MKKGIIISALFFSFTLFIIYIFFKTHQIPSILNENSKDNIILNVISTSLASHKYGMDISIYIALTECDDLQFKLKSENVKSYIINSGKKSFSDTDSTFCRFIEKPKSNSSYDFNNIKFKHTNCDEIIESVEKFIKKIEFENKIEIGITYQYRKIEYMDLLKEKFKTVGNELINKKYFCTNSRDGNFFHDGAVIHLNRGVNR